MYQEFFQLIAKKLEHRHLSLGSNKPVTLNGPCMLSNSGPDLVSFSHPTYFFSIGSSEDFESQTDTSNSPFSSAVLVPQMEEVDLQAIEKNDAPIFAIPLSIFPVLKFVDQHEFLRFSQISRSKKTKPEIVKIEFDGHLKDCTSLLISAHISEGPDAPRTSILNDELYAAFALSIEPATLLNTLNDKLRHPCISKAVHYIFQNIEKSFGLPELLDACELKSATLFSAFRRDIGQTPGNYIRNARIETAKKLLFLRSKYVSQVGFSVGYNSHTHFCRDFRATTGISPSEWRSLHLENETVLRETG